MGQLLPLTKTKFIMRQLFYFLFTISIILSSSNAFSQFYEVNLNSRVNQSQLIVEGKVISSRSFWDANQYNIYTANKIEVYKIFKGNLSSTTIEVITPGGIVGNHKETVEPSLALRNSDVGIFILKNSSIPQIKSSVIPQFEPYASVQGFIKYDLVTKKASSVFDSFNSIEVLLYNRITSITNLNFIELKSFSVSQKGNISNKMAPSISSFSPGTVTAGTKTQLTINGSGFGSTQSTSTVEFADANDGGSSFYPALATQTISWSATQIIVEVPDRAGTGSFRVVNGSAGNSPSSLTVSYAEINVESDALSSGTFVDYQTQHTDDDGSGGYTWQMFTDFDANASANASFTRAFDTWRCTGTNINWSIGSVTTTDQAANDGINVIRDDNGSELPAGILGRCTSRFSGCFEASTIHWYTTELDIVFDDGTNWNYGPAAPGGSEYDFETVAVHELGHGHQLAHVISPGAIMHHSISNGTQNRTLGVNDLAAGNDVMSRSTTQVYCGQGLMTNFSCGSVPVAAFSAASTAFCAGNSTIFTDASTNTPTGWAWIFTPATVTYINSTTSASQNPDVQFNAAGSYQVELTATNASGSDVETKVGYINVNACGTTSLQNQSVKTYVAYSEIVRCFSVSNAQEYEYEFTPSSGGGSIIYNRGIANVSLLLSWVTGLADATTYDVRIRAKVGGSFGAFGTTKQLTTPTFHKQTRIVSNFCGKVYSTYAEGLNAYKVANATEYEFEFDPVGGGSVITHTHTKNSILLSWVSGLVDGTIYNVRVRAKESGSYGAFGPNCQITTPAATNITNIITPHCGKVYNSFVDVLNAYPVNSATEYEFEFDPIGGGGMINHTHIKNSILLSWVTGLGLSTAYNVRVRCKVGSYGPYGNSCQITTPATARFGIFPAEAAGIQKIYSSLAINIYPNPSQGEFIYMELNGLQSNSEIMVTDIFGKTVLLQSIQAEYGSYNETLKFRKKLGAGFYFVTVNSGNQKVTKKLIVH